MASTLRKLLVAVNLALLWSGATVRADLLLFRESWTSNNAGWLDRDSGEMSVAWNSTGNTTGGLRGVFSNQANPSPQIDAFRATNTSSLGSFTGDYWASGQQPTRWTFDFLALHVVPSDILVRFNGGGSIYFQSVVSAVVQTGTWYTLDLSLSSGAAWNGVGVPDATLSNALHNVSWLDVQITRNGTPAQTYYIDNFSRYYDVVPEPGTLGLLTLFLLGYAMRRVTLSRMLAGKGVLRRYGSFLLLIGAGNCATAADLYTEAFTTGSQNWLSAGAWNDLGASGHLAAQFDAQGLPLAEAGQWIATNDTSGGAFTGSYTSVGAQLLGFSFCARDVLPSELVVRLRMTNGVFSRGLTSFVTVTGQWYRFQLSLADRDAGSWVGGSPPAFAGGLANIRALEIQVARNQGGEQAYWLDDVFLGRLPELRSVLPGPGVSNILVVGGTRSNYPYRIESASDLTGGWFVASSSITATAEQFSVSLPSAPFWRAVTEVAF